VKAGLDFSRRPRVRYVAGCASSYRAAGRRTEPLRAPPRETCPCLPSNDPESYTVKRGDTLYSIALDKDRCAWSRRLNITACGPSPPGAVCAP